VCCLGVAEPAVETWPGGSSGEEQGKGISSPTVSVSYRAHARVFLCYYDILKYNVTLCLKAGIMEQEVLAIARQLYGKQFMSYE
jgi:hypothetical protein